MVILGILYVAGILLIIVLAISGIIRVRLWGRDVLNEIKQIRLDIGKLSDKE